jgi:hypothetical protein
MAEDLDCSDKKRVIPFVQLVGVGAIRVLVTEVDCSWARSPSHTRDSDKNRG